MIDVTIQQQQQTIIGRFEKTKRNVRTQHKKKKKSKKKHTRIITLYYYIYYIITFFEKKCLKLNNQNFKILKKR